MEGLIRTVVLSENEQAVDPATLTSMATSSTRTSRRHINSPRTNVYRALLDPRAVQTWMVPTGMTRRRPAISPADNETGWRKALDKLAAFVESGKGQDQ